MSRFAQLQLTCSDRVEADKITEILLDQKLIACAKRVRASSYFHWKGQKEKADEVLLLMDSREDLYDKIELEVSKHHSYETFVLTMCTFERVSKEAEKWLTENLTQS